MNHRFITFGRIIKTGAQNFVRNATLAVAAIAVMVITLSIILFSVIANVTFTSTIKQLTDKIDISVYLKDDVTKEQLDDFMQNLRSMPNTQSVSYLSKEDALETYKQLNEDDIDLLLAISQTDNPLPATVKIKPVDPNRLQDIQAYLESEPIAALQTEATSYSGETKVAVDRITKAAQFLQRAGIGGVIIFAFVSMLIIFNTIRMAIFNRRDELQIMRLLGASTSYIRGPFVVETVIYGLVSAIISVALCNSVFAVSSSAFNANSLGLLDIGVASKYFADNFWVILAVQLTLGILIGAASSTIATTRYLKFKVAK